MDLFSLPLTFTASAKNRDRKSNTGIIYSLLCIIIGSAYLGYLIYELENNNILPQKIEGPHKQDVIETYVYDNDIVLRFSGPIKELVDIKKFYSFYLMFAENTVEFDFMQLFQNQFDYCPETNGKSFVHNDENGIELCLKLNVYFLYNIYKIQSCKLIFQLIKDLLILIKSRHDETIKANKNKIIRSNQQKEKYSYEYEEGTFVNSVTYVVKCGTMGFGGPCASDEEFQEYNSKPLKFQIYYKTQEYDQFTGIDSDYLKGSEVAFPGFNESLVPSYQINLESSLYEIDRGWIFPSVVQKSLVSNYNIVTSILSRQGVRAFANNLLGLLSNTFFADKEEEVLQNIIARFSFQFQEKVNRVVIQYPRITVLSAQSISIINLMVFFGVLIRIALNQTINEEIYQIIDDQYVKSQQIKDEEEKLTRVMKWKERIYRLIFPEKDYKCQGYSSEMNKRKNLIYKEAYEIQQFQYFINQFILIKKICLFLINSKQYAGIIKTQKLGLIEEENIKENRKVKVTNNETHSVDNSSVQLRKNSTNNKIHHFNEEKMTKTASKDSGGDQSPSTNRNDNKSLIRGSNTNTKIGPSYDMTFTDKINEQQCQMIDALKNHLDIMQKVEKCKEYAQQQLSRLKIEKHTDLDDASPKSPLNPQLPNIITQRILNTIESVSHHIVNEDDDVQDTEKYQQLQNLSTTERNRSHEGQIHCLKINEVSEKD